MKVGDKVSRYPFDFDGGGRKEEWYVYAIVGNVVALARSRVGVFTSEDLVWKTKDFVEANLEVQ